MLAVQRRTAHEGPRPPPPASPAKGEGTEVAPLRFDEEPPPRLAFSAALTVFFFIALIGRFAASPYCLEPA